MPERMLRDWTDSEPVNSLDWAAECLFTRLIMKADDFGRFHGNPRLLKSLLFPLKDGLRDADISRWIAACETAGLIRVYTDKVSGKPFIEIRNYGQRLRSKQAKFPDENGNFAVEREKPPQSAASCGGLPQSAAKCRKVPPEVEVEVEVEDKEREKARMRDMLLPAVERIKGKHPRLSEPPLTEAAIMKAIFGKIEKGASLEEAVSRIEQATEQYAAATAQWPENERRFIVSSRKWFENGGYDEPPKSWLIGDDKNAKRYVPRH